MLRPPKALASTIKRQCSLPRLQRRLKLIPLVLLHSLLKELIRFYL
jgi:hypothetical protein